jgi:anti-anti-sigma factor
MLTVASEQLSGTVVLAAEGELDAYTMRTLREALEQALEGSHDDSVVVDLAAVNFMDSTGLALMLNAARRLRRRRRGFAIVCPEGPIRRAFRVSGLEDCFTIRHGLREAVADAQPAFSGWPVA